jgi:hypothetical protein
VVEVTAARADAVGEYGEDRPAKGARSAAVRAGAVDVEANCIPRWRLARAADRDAAVSLFRRPTVVAPTAPIDPENDGGPVSEQPGGDLRPASRQPPIRGCSAAPDRRARIARGSRGATLVTDDAGIADPGTCQLEAWTQRGRDRSEHWLLPACSALVNPW